MNPNGNVRLLQLKHIGNGVFLPKPFCYVDEDFFVLHACSEIKENYLLINRLVASSMACCLMPKSGTKTITSVDVCWIAPDDKYNTKYLMYYLLSKCFQDKVAIYCSGSTRKRISKSNLIKINLLVHDISIQNQIVDEIETIFTTLEKIVG